MKTAGVCELKVFDMDILSNYPREGKELVMDAIVGRYRARMEESGLILRHASGINFDLTPEETLGLLDFINAYRQTLLSLQQERDTEPELERIVIDSDDNARGKYPKNKK